MQSVSLMSNLLTTQNQFQNYLLNKKSSFAKLIVSTKKVPAKTRLAIYHHAYHYRLIEALASNYPILKLYLGDDLFEQIAHDYIHQYPSSYRSIRWFGDNLSAFLREPYLAELAQFEWLQTLVFDAADSPILEINTLASLPADLWSTMRMQPHPSLQRMNTSWNSIALWQAIQDNENPPDPAQYTTPVPWLLWRSELINRFISLTEVEAWAIDAVLKGETFGEVCEGLCQWMDETAAGQYAACLLQKWIQSKLLKEIVHD